MCNQHIIQEFEMHHNHPSNRRVLFVLKYRQLYHDVMFDNCEKDAPYSYFSSGLLNSATQVNDMLNDHGVESKIVQVVDNNQIDKEVSAYKPTDVIIEALWVVPEKFAVLQKLYPQVRWIIRLHSDTPFLSNEGVAMEWLFKYIQYKNVYIGVNSLKMMTDLRAIFSTVKEYKLLYLPNYYDLDKNHEGSEHHDRDYRTIDIGCFGAIRPLKNVNLQAMAAIKFAKEAHKNLNFHINGSRVENNGNNVYRNLKSLFDGVDSSKYRLIEHGWLAPKDFRKLCAHMDMGMQVSYSETFNLVSADAVAQNVPIVVSSEVSWAACVSKVEDPTDIDSMVKTMHRVMSFGKIGTYLNKRGLNASNKKTVHAWLIEFK